VIVLSHFGRPDGKRVPEMSLKPLVEPLSTALGRPIAFAEDCIGPVAEEAARALKPGDVLLLENLRFHKEEEKNDAGFIDKLSVLGDIYVNDAFSAAHRAHASTEGLANRLPAAAGRLMQAELEALDKALGNPARPVCAVVGGAKVSTKLDLLGNLVGRVDKLIIGGGMANTFLAAQGIEVGKSLSEKDLAPTALEILAKAEAAKCKVLLPVDAVVAPELKANAPHRVVDVLACPDDQMILDIGPQSIALYLGELADCATLVWNGPLGAFEIKPFDAGTVALAEAVARLSSAGKLLSVAGGGDTVAALAAAGVEEKFSYVSAAGGAFLEWMEGKTLPGVAALVRAA
jgi:phosphoglycerate kinase